MSQANVEVVKAAFAAYNRGDLDAWLAEADPDVEWHVLPEATDPGPHRGRQVILERAALWRQTLGGFGRRSWSTSTQASTSSRPVRLRGQPPGSDAEVVLDEVYVSKFRNGKIVELREYRTKAEALEAVGLWE